MKMKKIPEGILKDKEGNLVCVICENKGEMITPLGDIMCKKCWKQIEPV